MAKYRITAPDGQTYEITAPDTASEDEVLAYAQKNYQMAASPKADFSNVQTTVSAGNGNTFRAAPAKPPRRDATPAQVNAYLDRITGTNLDPTSIDARPREQTDVSAWDLIPAVNVARRINTQEKRNNLLAGIGKAFADVPHMARQAALQADVVKTGLEAAALNRIAPNAGNEWVRRFGLPAQDRLNEQYAVNADRAQIDAPLMSTGQGISGYITGSAAQFMGPGAALRGTAGARAFLPATIGGNAIQGGVLGWMQPAENPQQQMENARTGALLGGGLAAIPSAARKIRGLFSGNGLTGVETRAGKVLQEALDGRPMVVEQSAVPGVNRTLGDATRDAGIAQLERSARGNFPAKFTGIDSANNTARVNALQAIAGDEGMMARAEARREALTSAARRQAFDQANAARSAAQDQRALMAGAAMPDPVSSLRSQVHGIARAKSGRPTTQAALNDVSRALEQSGGTPEGLYQVRQYIGDLMSGKAGADKGYAKAATSELMKIRDLIDGQLESISPGWRNYLTSFQDASKPIGRMQIGQELMHRVTPGGKVDAIGNPLISPAKAATSAKPRMLDQIAQKATGFGKAKAADILTPDQLQTISAIRQDAQREMFRQANAATINSPTDELGNVTKRILAKNALGSASKRIPLLGAVVDSYQQTMDKALQAKIADIIANPSEAQRILNSLTPAQRTQVLGIISRAGGTTGGAMSPLFQAWQTNEGQ